MANSQTQPLEAYASRVGKLSIDDFLMPTTTTQARPAEVVNVVLDLDDDESDCSTQVLVRPTKQSQMEVQVQSAKPEKRFQLTLDDFLNPVRSISMPTMVHEMVATTLNLNDVTLVNQDDVGETVELSDEDFNATLLSSLADWQMSDDDLDCAVRKTIWPQINASQYRPAGSEMERMKTNVEAIKLLRRLQAEKSAPTEEQTAKLLSYCGWGGLARILGPEESLASNTKNLRAELNSLTNEEEFRAMSASVTSAFFTDPDIVASVWRAIQHMGFKGGRICEPSGGVGTFLMGMPREIALRSDITAVELDKITSQILQTCFEPYGVQVHACGLEDAKIPGGFYDLVVGNVPFGNYQTGDTSRSSYSDWSIHNWFLAKSIELVRPGGLVVVLSSRYSMDAKAGKHREWLAHRADLLGAIRLPTMTFKDSANTEAVTDLLVFKRKEMPDFTASPVWTAITDTPQSLMAPGEANWKWSRYGSNKEVVQINAYYAKNAQGVIGKLKSESGQFGPVTVPVFDGNMEDLSQRVDVVLQQLVEKDVYKAASGLSEVLPVSTFVRYENLLGAQPGSFVLSKGRICLSEGEELLDVDDVYKGTSRKRLIGMMDIRDKAIETINHQAVSDDDNRLVQLQRQLNSLYDNFVSQCGAISTTANARLMRSDPSWPIMLALEIWDEEEQKAIKADIFHKRTVGKIELPQKVDNVKDAMLISLAAYGKIVLKDMAIRTGRPVMEVVNDMKNEGLAYRDPALARWVPADEYLSGNIREKIAAAQAAGPAYTDNVQSLATVLPKDLGPAEVEVRLGASWVPTEIIKQFAFELVNHTGREDSLKVSYDSQTATWSLDTSWRLENFGDRSAQTIKWGTSSRCALELLQGALNQQPPTVSYTIDGKTHTDVKRTLEAREKWQAIRDHFRQWVYRDDDRRDKLLRIYNDTFNQIVPRKFDGAHLHLPGMSAAVKPYPFQKDVIWRIVVNGNTLLAHAVGAGKTLEMLAASMELRRLGKARKPLHVVLNHCLEQYTSEALRLYPQAKVLMATKNDLVGDKRRTFVARVATGDWDMVVMTQATFQSLMLSPEKQMEFIRQQTSELRASLAQTKDRGAKRGIKEMERRMADYEAKLKKHVENALSDKDAVYFDHLGIDALFIDEAHVYKNLGRASKMPRIAGLPNTASQRAFDVFMKTRLIMEQRGGAQENVIFATATPVSNSLAETYTMQYYLQPQTLKKYGIYEFDAWSSNFGEAVTGLELAPDGSGFRTNTRYARFSNLPELMAIFKEVADIKTKSMLKLPTPPIIGGGPRTVVVKPSEALKELTQKLVERAEKVRQGGVDPKVDNMLAITNDGRRAALDLRLVVPTMPAEPGCKLEAAAANIFRIWEDGKVKRLTQLVFSDIGTPGAPGFSVYEDLRDRLIKLGIPLEDIVFIHDHDSDTAKAKLFKKVRDGAVRILMGSTEKLGTGTNVQTRLVAVHQLDAPWRPSDVEQRDGRADRQGNMCENIELWRYLTEGSFDAYSWQTLACKAKFIEQIMTAGQGLRSVEDLSMTAMTYAEIKALASGNPLVIEKAEIDIKVQKLTLSLDHWEQDRWRTSRRNAEIKARLAYIEKALPLLEKDVAAVKQAVNADFKPSGELMTQAVSGVTGPKAIGVAFKTASGFKIEQEVGAIGEFVLFAAPIFKRFELQVKAPYSGITIEARRPEMFDLDGVGMSAYAAIKSFEAYPAKFHAEMVAKREELARGEGFLQDDFPSRDELNAALRRQNEIEQSLDLDKDTDGTAAMQQESPE